MNNIQFDTYDPIEWYLLREAITVYSRSQPKVKYLNKMQKMFDLIEKVLDVNGWPDAKTMKEIENPH